MSRNARRRAVVLLAAALAACAQAPADGDAAASQERAGGFRNAGTDAVPKGLRELLRWRVSAWREGLPQPPREPIPTRTPERDFIHANARAGASMQPAVTWIGHSTVLAQLGGLNVLTDPIFSERASPLSFVGPKRHQPPALSLAALPHVDVVLVSHNHYDHCDVASLQALNAQPGGPPVFVVPLGLKHWLAGIGIDRAVELGWWQSHRVGDAEIVLTPVQHWSGRTLTDRMATLWGGFAVFTPSFHLFHAGDTGYSADFAEIRRRFAARQGAAGFDLALLPIGAYEPRWFMQPQHVDPVEAVRIHRDLVARRSLAVHWGTFEMSDESLDEPPRALARARREHGVGDDEFFTLAIGETRRLARRGE